MQQIQPELAAALVAAQRMVKPVEKDSTNAYHKYAYASAEAMIAEGRSVLHSNGLALSAISREVLPVTEGHAHARVRMTFALVHAATGQSVMYTWEASAIPEKGRPQDKAEAGADTSCTGYAYRGVLALPRAEEGQVDQRNDTAYDPGTPAPQAAPPPRPNSADEAVLTTFRAELGAAETMQALQAAYAKVRAASDAGGCSMPARDAAYAAFSAAKLVLQAKLAPPAAAPS